MHVVVVVNPLAGGQHMDGPDDRAVHTLVARVAACSGATADVYVTKAPGGARTGARGAVESGADVVIAWGGDGTVNEVASVLAGTDVGLGIVPVGSGNGLAREMRIPGRPADALRLAFRRVTRVIDVGALGDRAFVNVAGFGFDAWVARQFNSGDRTRGFLRYVWFTVTEIFRYPPQHYVIRWDGGAFEGPALIVAFANSRQYRNGARLAPVAEVDDGAVDLVIVRPTTAGGDLWRSRKLFMGSILGDPGVTHARVRQASVRAEGGLCCHVDGEPLDPVLSADVRVRPRALRVCVG